MKEKYVNLFTDFGFKKLFGEESSKTHLIAFLNTLLPAKHHIKELSYTNNEKLGATPADRKAIFDLHCVNQHPNLTTLVLCHTPAFYCGDNLGDYPIRTSLYLYS